MNNPITQPVPISTTSQQPKPGYVNLYESINRLKSVEAHLRDLRFEISGEPATEAKSEQFNNSLAVLIKEGGSVINNYCESALNEINALREILLG